MEFRWLGRMSSILLGIASLFIQNVSGYAQKEAPLLVLADTVYNLGNIAEEKGPVRAVLSFSNQGSLPLIITQVTTDCGCTTSSYTQEVIPPGGQGRVEVQYNPIGRPGPFVRTVRIHSNADNVVKAVIKGVVTTLGGATARKYSHEIGPLKVSGRNLSFSVVTPTKQTPMRLQLYNLSSQSLRIRFLKVPSFLTLDKRELVLSPQEPEELEVVPKLTASARSKIYEGSLEIEVIDEKNGKEKGKVFLTMPFLKAVPQQEDKVARLKLNTYHDLGVAERTSTYKGRVQLENEGEKVLLVYGAISENDILKISSFNTQIKPGKSGNIAYTIDMSKVSEGEVFATNIVLLVNDPTAPLRKIKVQIQALNKKI